MHFAAVRVMGCFLWMSSGLIKVWSPRCVVWFDGGAGSLVCLVSIVSKTIQGFTPLFQCILCKGCSQKKYFLKVKTMAEPPLPPPPPQGFSQSKFFYILPVTPHPLRKSSAMLFFLNITTTPPPAPIEKFFRTPLGKPSIKKKLLALKHKINTQQKLLKF